MKVIPDLHYHCHRCGKPYNCLKSFTQDYMGGGVERVLVCHKCEPK
ncbi:MAG: hypothetical protein AABY22_03105 [Nanoarchaeota archaeon]